MKIIRLTAINIMVAMALFVLVGCGATSGPMVDQASLEATITARIVATQAATVPGSIAGVISWATQGAGNRVVVGITVRVWKADSTEQAAIGITDATGRFSVPGLRPAVYVVSAYQPASTTGTQIAEKCWVFENVQVKPGEAAQVNFDFTNSVPASVSKYPQCTN